MRFIRLIPIFCFFGAVSVQAQVNMPDPNSEIPLSEAELIAVFKGQTHRGTYSFQRLNFKGYGFEETTSSDGTVKHVQDDHTDTGSYEIKDDQICFSYTISVQYKTLAAFEDLPPAPLSKETTQVVPRKFLKLTLAAVLFSVSTLASAQSQKTDIRPDANRLLGDELRQSFAGITHSGAYNFTEKGEPTRFYTESHKADGRISYTEEGRTDLTASRGNIFTTPLSVKRWTAFISARVSALVHMYSQRAFLLMERPIIAKEKSRITGIGA